MPPGALTARGHSFSVDGFRSRGGLRTLDQRPQRVALVFQRAQPELERFVPDTRFERVTARVPDAAIAVAERAVEDGLTAAGA